MHVRGNTRASNELTGTQSRKMVALSTTLLSLRTQANLSFKSTPPPPQSSSPPAVATTVTRSIPLADSFSFAWVRSDSSVVLSATFCEIGCPVSSFDALVFAPHVHAPAVFAVYRTVRACLAGIAQLDSVATVVSPFSAASASEWSLVYPVPIAKQDEFSACDKPWSATGRST
ncbi:hypothetical protein BASA81_011246 [Batrachochytrium salamandrivorans]|nr:hypothetical protein BASA81_011246 [Batrachochytrium salamandrivorans]